MKNIFYILLCLPFIAIGQTTTENYVKTTIYKQPTTAAISTPTITEADQYVTYLDGLGRPIQNVASKQSASGKNIIKPIFYDASGRIAKDYLPYSTQTNGLNFESNSLSDLGNYYNTATYSNTTNPFSEIAFEASPMNRISQKAAPGFDWAIAQNHTNKVDYANNTITDQVKIYKVVANWDNAKGLYDIVPLTETGYYAANKLQKTIVKNENWTSGTNNTTEQFTDGQGKIVLTRTYGESIVNNTSINTRHDVYYVYDQFGNLTYVLPPAVDTGSTITSTILNNLCYQYKYDNRNRLVEKKLPGKQWEFIVYDNLNRVIATGPGFSPFPDAAVNTYGWLITKYDNFDRAVYKGWYQATVDNTSRKNLQTIQNALTTAISESKTTSSTTIDGVSVNYTNVVSPTTFKLLTVNYYDDYNFPISPAISFSNVEGQTVYYNNTVKPIGLSTGMWVRVLDDSTAPVRGEMNYALYDYKARPIRRRTENYLGGYLQIDTKMDFLKTLYTVTKQKRINTDTEISVKDDYTYTAQDRLLTHTHQINSNAPELIAKNEYDELGQLIVKRVGGSDLTGAACFQKVDYAYNVRGWLTDINNVANLTQGTDPQDLFAFKINYNTVENEDGYSGKTLYNGNISETYWRSKADNVLRKYGYFYDDLDRMKSAIYQRPDLAYPVTDSYNEYATYDKNGNIQKIERNGDLDSAVDTIQMDNLTFTYNTNNSNELLKVFDTSNHPEGFKDDEPVGTTPPTDPVNDYTYDANGNLSTDQNKGITGIKYNHLNLPIEIIFENNQAKKITYLYNALGDKLQKYDANTTVRTEYFDGFQYEQVGAATTKLVYFFHAEGYVNNTVINNVNVYNYIFNYKDHLGNVRMSYAWDTATSSLKIFEETHYFPFGLKHTKYNKSQYQFIASPYGGYNTGIAGRADNSRKIYNHKFNDKEFQEELKLNVYDYGFRNYDPAIGRWMNIDPLAEISSSVSPFSYGYNNPLFYIDSDGQIPTPFEAAVMAADVYNPRGRTLPGGWRLSKIDGYNIDNKRSGMKATMYERTKNGKKEYAYVYAGTDDLQDVFDDIMQPLGASRQYYEAKSKAQRIHRDFNASEVTFVGHSLGGGLANYSSLFTGRSSMTFNPAWLSMRIIDKFQSEVKTLRKGSSRRNFVHESDPLNDIQQAYGDEVGLEEIGEHIEIEGGWGTNIFTGHLIDEMVDRMIENGDSDGYERSDQDWYERHESPRYN